VARLRGGCVESGAGTQGKSTASRSFLSFHSTTRWTVIGDRSDMIPPQAQREVLEHVDHALATIDVHLPLFLAPFSSDRF
jgi:hypothetical protein